MNNNKGFTLIELIVVIAVIAMLSITISVSTKTLTENTKNSSYQNTFEDIFKAARIYANLYSIPEGCNKCDGINTCNVTLNCLVQKGLLDEDIYEKENPMKTSSNNFSKDDKVEITFDDGKTNVSYTCGDSEVNSDDVYEKKYDDWGKCS